MKAWHLIAVLVIGYIVGAIFPGPFTAIKGKLSGAVAK